MAEDRSSIPWQGRKCGGYTSYRWLEVDMEFKLTAHMEKFGPEGDQVAKLRGLAPHTRG